MIIEAWIAMDQAALNVLWEQAHSETAPEDLKLLTNGIRGYWNDITPNEVVNVIGSVEDLEDFESLIGADLKSIDPWYQGMGVDYNLHIPWLTEPVRILSFMPPFIEYDEDGNVISTTPATFENPNWAHTFAGQPPDLKIFAGEFTDEFTEEFL